MSTVGSQIVGNRFGIGIEPPQIRETGNNFESFSYEGIGLLVLPDGWEFEADKYLNSPLLVEIRAGSKGVMVVTYLEAEEYGWGGSKEEAIMDLMQSLLGYLESLEAREGRLCEAARKDLVNLRSLIRRA